MTHEESASLHETEADAILSDWREVYKDSPTHAAVMVCAAQAHATLALSHRSATERASAPRRF